MLLHYKPMGSQDAQQLRMEAADDKKVASLWLAAMHKVRRPEAVLSLHKHLLLKSSWIHVFFMFVRQAAKLLYEARDQ